MEGLPGIRRDWGRLSRGGSSPIGWHLTSQSQPSVFLQPHTLPCLRMLLILRAAVHMTNAPHTHRSPCTSQHLHSTFYCGQTQQPGWAGAAWGQTRCPAHSRRPTNILLNEQVQEGTKDWICFSQAQPWHVPGLLNENQKKWV